MGYAAPACRSARFVKISQISHDEKALNLTPLSLAHRAIHDRKFEFALGIYDDLLKEDPTRTNVWINRGVALQGLYRLDEAMACYDKAIEIKPDDPAGYINRGVVRNWMGQYNASIGDYSRALEMEPDNESALLGRSTVLAALDRTWQAIDDCDRVLASNPGCAGAHYSKGLYLLELGSYEEGFREHEWRFGTPNILGPYRFPGVPVWAGQKTNKRIAVNCEQGLGDSIQFVRYVQFLSDMKLDFFVEAPAALVRLFEGLDIFVVERGKPLPRFDLQCPIMTLATIFGTTLDTIPFKEGYLGPTYSKDIHRWSHVFSKFSMPWLPRVGLCWSSGVRLDQPIARAMQKRKSIPTTEINDPLYGHFDGVDINFVSLQKDVPPDGKPGGLYDPMDECADLLDTTSVIANLDLVITVDSAVAHLACAMGKETWVLNRRDICWRWLSGSKESPWYSSARIYRQSEHGRWDDVIDDVRKDLCLWLVNRQGLRQN